VIFLAQRGSYKSSESTRDAILAALATTPGMSRSDIIRATGISWGSVAHHVHRMVEAGTLHVDVVGRRPYYYLEPPKRSLLPITRLLRSEPVALEVLRLLNDETGISINAMSARLQHDRKTIRRTVAQLEQSGMVAPLTRTIRRGFQLVAVPVAFAVLLKKSLDEALA
jgi:DNA-binding MarR family transcriptional regulator